MTRKKTAPAEQDATPEAKPKRVALRNTNRANGEVGAIAKPLEKDVAAWLALGWVKA